MIKQWGICAASLESAVYGYGCPGYTREKAEKEFGCADYKATSIFDHSDRDKIMESIDVSSAYKWMGENDIALIHYENIPLNGIMSDLTARFLVRKVDDNEITLWLLMLLAHFLCCTGTGKVCPFEDLLALVA